MKEHTQLFNICSFPCHPEEGPRVCWIPMTYIIYFAQILVEVKLSLRLIKRHAVETYERVEA
jgi:hypothetical protein